MGLIIDQTIEMGVTGNAINYYESKGYVVPKRIDSQGRLYAEQGTKIFVSVMDLPSGSNKKIKVKCDICGIEEYIIFADYCKKFNNNEYVCNDIKFHKKINLDAEYENCVNQINLFFNINKRFPKYNEYTIENNLMSYHKFQEIAHMKNMTVNDILLEIDCFLCKKPSVKYYDKYIEKFKKIIEENRVTDIWDFIRYNNTGIPDIRWLIDNNPDKNIKSSDDLLNLLGLYNSNIPKNKVIDLIYELQENVNRPLMYDDFRNSGYNKVTTQMIKKYFGTLNDMKNELGLEIIQKSMIDKQISIEQAEEMINKVCSGIYREENRKLITTSDFDKSDDCVTYTTIYKYFKKYRNITATEYIKSIGFELVKEGRGLSHEFDDGEKTFSQFEYIFSNYLREFGFIYDVSYFRDVKYKEFIDNYNGNQNCDYIIVHNNRQIFIEIAGILNQYKTWYYSNKKILKSNSKENYRIKLLEKENMLKNMGLEYFILFPCDLTKDNFKKILNCDYNMTKLEIENFYKNNIVWKKISNKGELKYKEKKTGNKIIMEVDYN